MVMLTTTHLRSGLCHSAQDYGVFSARSVLQELGGQWPRSYLFGTMQIISGLLAAVTSVSRS